MTDIDILSMLKVDLGILSATAYDERLMQYINSAQEMIEREGISLRDSAEDAELIVMYTAWMWRKRDTGEAMPRMLRFALNNRLFAEKSKVNRYV